MDGRVSENQRFYEVENLKEKIQQELKNALKERKETEVSVLRMVLAAIINKEKEKRYKISKEEPDSKKEDLQEKSQLTDEEVIEVIFSETKKRKEAVEEFSAYSGSAEGGKKEKIEKFINKEKEELEVLKKYLPKQLSEQEIKQLAQETIKEIGAESLKDMGKVMGELMPKVKGRVDGNTVSLIVKELLS